MGQVLMCDWLKRHYAALMLLSMFLELLMLGWIAVHTH